MRASPLTFLAAILVGCMATGASVPSIQTKKVAQIRCKNPACRRLNPVWAEVCQYCGKRLRRPHPPGPPPSPTYASLVRQAEVAVSHANWSTAAAIYSKALAKQSNGVQALAGLALCEYEVGQKEQASKHANAAWEANDRSARTNFVLGMMSLEDSKAIPLLKASLHGGDIRIRSAVDSELKTRFAAHLTAGNQAVRESKWADGRREYELARQCDPISTSILPGLALCLHEVALQEKDSKLDYEARRMAESLQSQGDPSPWVSLVLMLTSNGENFEGGELAAYVDKNPGGQFTAEAQAKIDEVNPHPKKLALTMRTNVSANIIIRDSKGATVVERKSTARAQELVELPTGKYQISASADGFIALEKTVNLDQSQDLDLSLAIAGQPDTTGWNPLPFDLARTGLAIGNTMTNPKDFSVFVWVPEGDFKSGKENKPVHLPGYWIARNCVTWSQYLSFCHETNRRLPEDPGFPHESDHPVVNVSIGDALAYAKWAGATLPTGDQWEKAARSTDGRIFPWGNAWVPGNAQISEGTDGAARSTSPVSAHEDGKSLYGCRDMVGNVSQWILEWHDGAGITRGRGWFDSNQAHWPDGPCIGGSVAPSTRRDIGFRLASPIPQSTNR